MKKIFGSLAVSVLLAAPLFVACGSSGIDSGVDDTKKGSDLDGDEVTKVCEAVIDYTSDALTGLDQATLCKWTGAQAAAVYAAMPGATDESIQEGCQQIVDGCLDAEPVEDDGDDGSVDDDVCDAVTPAVVADCTSTVGDIETCVTERTDAQTEAIKSSPACADLTLAYFEDAEPAGEESAACKDVSANCAVIGGLTGGGGNTPPPGGFAGASNE